MTKKEALDIADYLSDSLRQTRPAAKALLEWGEAGCPERLTPELMEAMKTAVPEAECARASGALWIAGDDVEDLDALN